MSFPVIGYPTPGKEKARHLLEAFCAGAKGAVVGGIPRELAPGAAAFYGVTPATKHLFDQARAEGRDWYYIDNAYFDATRQVYFRVTKNALQHSGRGVSDGRRFAELGIEIRPWRKCGEHLLVCPQSEDFMRTVVGYEGCWWEKTIDELRELTLRPVRLRPWQRDKAAWYATLPGDLEGCWALVTHSSASAISALLAGVPAFCTARDCIAACMTLGDLNKNSLEHPFYPTRREEWAQVVADHQWTLEEMRSGLAWKMLQRAAVAA